MSGLKKRVGKAERCGSRRTADPGRGIEQMMKAAAGKLKSWEAAEIMGVTDRTMRRWRERLNEHGYSGLWDYRKRRPSPKRVPMVVVLRLYREQYFDCSVRHFYEKLRTSTGLL